MKIAIVDYGMGNLQSVFNSVQTANELEALNAEIVLTADSGDILSADKIIFPGQGAMPDCMASLHKSGLIDVLHDCLQKKPFLGICVGAQLLFEYSEEGNTTGLGWFKGTVARFTSEHVDGQGRYLKVPHMGWNQVYQTQTHPLFAAIEQNEWFYFVHSYYFLPRETDNVFATADYPNKFACIVSKDNVFATQFHTEKSHTAGLQLLRNFLLWNG
ncbi:MAG: imidazole glycerol phosphate synthase subunit HisH [Snodgrassella sp.]|nr:imidazole glycerol phosphate synthase subunit HisH [Snodgrassella sp.]